MRIEEPIGDYLWDRTGEPDAELRRLEELLARYRGPRVPASGDARRASPSYATILPFAGNARQWGNDG